MKKIFKILPTTALLCCSCTIEKSNISYSTKFNCNSFSEINFDSQYLSYKNTLIYFPTEWSKNGKLDELKEYNIADLEFELNIKVTECYGYDGNYNYSILNISYIKPVIEMNSLNLKSNFLENGEICNEYEDGLIFNLKFPSFNEPHKIFIDSLTIQKLKLSDCFSVQYKNIKHFNNQKEIIEYEIHNVSVVETTFIF